MEDEVINEVETEIIESEVENTQPEVKEEEKVVERPWKKEKEEEQAIPYSRFKDVNEEKKLYKEKVEQYERELAELKQKVEPKKKEIEDPDELDPAEFETVKDYLKARDKVQAEKIQRDFMERMENTKRAKEEEEYRTTLITNFQKNVEETAKYNPEVVDAIQYIEKFSEKINPIVRKALLIDENAGDLCFEIATNPKLLEKVVSGDPVDAIRAMATWSARFTREEKKEEATKSNTDDVVDTIRAMVPKTVKGSISNGKKDPSKMSYSEYKKSRGF